MKLENDSELHVAGINTKRNKAPYQAPVVRVYGTVALLTGAKGGTLADGQSGMNMV